MGNRIYQKKEYCEMIEEDINKSLNFFFKRIKRAKIDVPEYIYEGLEYFADEAYSEILTRNNLHDYYRENVISF